MIADGVLEVYLHPSNICTSVQTGDKVRNDNEKQLQHLLEVELEEIAIRKTYDEKYGIDNSE